MLCLDVSNKWELEERRLMNTTILHTNTKKINYGKKKISSFYKNRSVADRR